jgi:hypothetical protein
MAWHDHNESCGEMTRWTRRKEQRHCVPLRYAAKEGLGAALEVYRIKMASAGAGPLLYGYQNRLARSHVYPTCSPMPVPHWTRHHAHFDQEISIPSI